MQYFNKKIVYALLQVLFIFSVGFIGKYLFYFLESEETKDIWALSAIILTSFYIISKHNMRINRTIYMSNFDKSIFYYIYFLVILMFVINAYQLSIVHNNDLGKKYIENAYLYLGIYFPFLAIAEEMVYRGFLQSYIDIVRYRSFLGISLGNLIASFITTIVYVCFFVMLPFYVSHVAILVVFISSLVIGFIYYKTDQNILVCSLIHLLLYYVHFSVYCLAHL